VPITSIVSGGQTGADRAALDVARALRLPYGGWCPSGGWAEDLPDPPGLLARYPLLRPAPPGPASTRTLWNVRDSDATLVLVLMSPAASRGTRSTVDAAAALGRPHLVVPADDDAAVLEWIGSLRDLSTLNVAGPRESEEPGLYDAAYRTLTTVLTAVTG
jgi:hypothetical protein